MIPFRFNEFIKNYDGPLSEEPEKDPEQVARVVHYVAEGAVEGAINADVPVDEDATVLVILPGVKPINYG